MFFSVVFDDGFALLANAKELMWLIIRARNVEVETFATVEGAYANCCKKYVRRWVEGGQKAQPLLPRLEGILQAGGIFFNSAGVAKRELVQPIFKTNRIFSVVGSYGCSATTDIYTLFNILALEGLPWLRIFEMATEAAAVEKACHEYKIQQMAVSAYFKEMAHVPDMLTANEIFLDDRLKASLERSGPSGFLPEK